MPLAEHFLELRERLLKSLIFILVSIVTVFFNIQYIIKIIQKPAEGIKFIQLAPGEYFFSTVKISIYLGLIISIPYILYEILQFTIPAMTIKEKRLILPMSIISAILFFGGIIFAYFILLSPALRFFISYGANIIEPIWSFEYYFNFVILLLLVTGIAFQIPIFEIILAIFGLLSSSQLISYWSLIKLSAIVIILLKFSNSIVNAYPIYAQQAYENPREATGRIVCANCHLAQKDIQLNIPKSVLPNSVFEAVVKIPYPNNAQQILANANKGPLNVGAILILPEGFSLAPTSRLSEEQKAIAKITPIQTYNNQHKNILVVGPLPGDKHKEISFPILSPDPQSNKQIHFIKYPIYAGGNRGRGQLYPNGEKSNNALYTSPVDGKIIQINKEENNSTKIVIETNRTNGKNRSSSQ
ncbi:[pt] cytochrome f [Galdieria sulphuraria]|uniref:Cytochrome f n=1 Tax=Galdieria sulphuraria TaxID=130081 RepID=M2XXZ8_GALSU|nr:[pt] cytochrome f [Galdieria sulphuraria]EME28508.1 [pt] cytochrome f [Galdieria sulphuraria]|eukprot:XP_005705028.1 [pt] cytochrome f [Galdieria sulphuraria]